MQFIKPDVSTMCVGIAMSMGSLLLAGGAKGKRMALPNSRILIHQPSAGFEGQSTDIEIHAAEILKTRKRIDEIYAKHTGQPEEQVHRDMERDRFFKPDQAAEYGRRGSLASGANRTSRSGCGRALTLSHEQSAKRWPRVASAAAQAAPVAVGSWIGAPRPLQRGFVTLVSPATLPSARGGSRLMSRLHAVTRVTVKSNASSGRGPSPHASPRFAGRGRRNSIPSPREAAAWILTVRGVRVAVLTAVVAGEMRARRSAASLAKRPCG